MIRATRLIAHHWALPEAARSAAGTWTERRSLLLVVEDGAGHVGLGEAAPLPGYSRDTLDAARASLSALLGVDLPERDPARALHAELEALSARMTSLAARAALEAAVLDLWARREGVPAWSLLAVNAVPESVPVAVWLPDGAAAAASAAQAAWARGVRAFKVKLDARRGLDDGVATLVALRRTLGREVTLRADANQSATLAALEPHIATLLDLELEWLEEPTSEALSKPLGVPVALDESLAGAALPPLSGRPDVVAFVLKPTALGGLARCLTLAAHAEAHGRASVASHTLEGPVGFMTAAALALAVPQRAAHGLGRYGRLRSGAGCPALPDGRDALVRWEMPGLGLELDEALAGAVIDATEPA